MWPFRRKDTTTTQVSSDADDYYRTERRERVGLAWLLAFGSLIATVLIALALFYGVRFIYHKIHHTNTTATNTSTSQSTDQSSGSSASGTQTTGQTNAPGSSTTTTPSTSSSTSTNSSTASGTSATGSNAGTNLANTGPGSTITIFFAVSILGALAHNAYQRRKIAQEL